jgi:hypothetical protein
MSHVRPPGLIDRSFLVQYLIFLTDPALAIRQQNLNGVLPLFPSGDRMGLVWGHASDLMNSPGPCAAFLKMC